MDTRSGKIEFLENLTDDEKKHYIEIMEESMTEKQAEERKVSLHDHRSKLGKQLTGERQKRGYSQMTKNQKRKLRNKLSR